MAVRSRRLWARGSVPGSVPTALFTCPAGRTAIVRGVRIYNPQPAVAPTVLSLLPAEGGAVTLVYVRLAESTGWDSTFRDLTLNPGDAVQLMVYLPGGPQPIETAGWGSLLLGAPS